MPVVAQPSLVVLLLPLKLNLIARCDPGGLRRPLDHLPRFAPSLVRRFPHHIAHVVRHHQRRADLIAITVEDARFRRALRHPLQQAGSQVALYPTRLGNVRSVSGSRLPPLELGLLADRIICMGQK